MFEYFKSIPKSCTTNNQSERIKEKDTPEERLGKEIITNFQDEIKCSICWRSMYRCRTIAPCMHNFCSFCLSEYLSRNYWQALCPICRGEIQSWNKNILLDKLIECMDEYHPEPRPSDEEKMFRDEKDLLIKGAKIQKNRWNGAYFGFLKNGKREGKGKFRNYLHSEYDGNWKDDKREGYGEMNYSHGMKYKGGWKKDMKNGYGEEIWSDGEQYKGEFKDGKFEGFGEYTWATGNRYIGQFKDSRLEGQGELYYVTGERYKGEWKKGMRHGFGELIRVDGGRDVGEWKDDRFYGGLGEYDCVNGGGGKVRRGEFDRVYYYDPSLFA